jgi:hypothetical protein
MVLNAATLGLKPEIAAYVLENNPTNMSDVYAYARVAEVTRQSTVNTSETMNNQMSSLARQMTDMNTKLSQLAMAAIDAKETTVLDTNKAKSNEESRRSGQKEAITSFRPRYQNYPIYRPFNRPQGNYNRNLGFQKPSYGQRPYQHKTGIQFNPPPFIPQTVETQMPGAGPFLGQPVQGMPYLNGPTERKTTNINRRCYICNRLSHLAHDCWYKGQNN